MRAYLLKTLTLLVLLALGVTGVSNSQAQEQVVRIVGEQAFTGLSTLDQLLSYNDASYYLYYYPPLVNPNRMFIAVEPGDDAYTVVTGNATLDALARATYQIEALNAMKNQRLGFTHVAEFARNARQTYDRTQSTYDTVVIGQLQAKYPRTRATTVGTKLTAVGYALSALETTAGEGQATQASFENGYLHYDLEPYTQAYQRTLTAVAEYLAAAEDYQRTVDTVAKDVLADKNLSTTQKTETKTALEQVYDVGAWQTFRQTYQLAKSEWDLRAIREDEWVATSLESFAYQKKRADVRLLFENEKIGAERLFEVEPDIASCGAALETQFKTYKTGWNQAQALYNRGDSSAYDNLTVTIPQLEIARSGIENKYDKCVAGAASVKPVETPTGGISPVTLGLILVVLVGGYVAYQKYKQRQQTEGEGPQ